MRKSQKKLINWTSWNETTKAKWIKIAKEHREQDRFIQGSWLENNSDTNVMHRGCFFGCMMQTAADVLITATREMNLPAWIVYVAEKIFEGLPKEEAVLFPVQLLESIPLNKNTYQIYKDWHYTILMDKNKGQINYCGDNKQCADAVRQCADIFKLEKITESAARSAVESARAAARSVWSAGAAESAAWSAESAAESAARSAAWSAESAARSAAWSAWSAGAAESAAWSAYYQWLRDTLIRLLS